MSVGFLGQDPLNNLTNLYQRPIFIEANRAPTSNDIQPPGTFWQNGSGGTIYQTSGSGTWNSIAGSGVATLTGNSGGAIGPSAGNINVIGTGDVTVTGSGHQLAISVSGGSTVISTIDADSGSATPSSGVVTISGGSTGLTTSASSSTVDLTGTLNVANGGTGATTLTGVLTGNGTSAVTANTVTNHGVVVGGASNAVGTITVGTNGQILIGSTGANPAFGTLTSTTGVTFTGGAGSLAINTTGGGLKANSVTGASATGATQSSYICSDSAQTTVSLPTTSALGDFFLICGTSANTGGWVVSQASGQQILNGTNRSTSGATGSISTAAANTSALLVCTAANTTWIAIATVGTVTYT